jgi:xanthine dehydrogenase accessory factor
MTDPFVEISGQLNRGKKVVLARIIRQTGSAPRSVGTRCLVLEDGTLMGTIGGGLLEHQVHEGAKEALREGRTRILHFRLMGEDVSKTDMLCGGLADVFLEPLFPSDSEARTVFEQARLVFQKGRVGTLLTRISEGVSPGEVDLRALLTPGADELPSWVDGSEGRGEEIMGARRSALMEAGAGGFPVFVEPLRPEDVVILFGAGHVSTFVAPLAKMAGFRVVVVDDREEFANRERFPHADDIVMAPFSEAFHRLSVTGSSYLVIVTRGHIHDTTVLRSAVRSDAAYIGMIGSRRKRNTVYGALMDEGVARPMLDLVHSPIGVDIGAETPEEIAISIVAELIQVRAEKER